MYIHKKKTNKYMHSKNMMILGGYFDPYHTYIVLEQFFCTEIQK